MVVEEVHTTPAGWRNNAVIWARRVDPGRHSEYAPSRTDAADCVSTEPSGLALLAQRCIPLSVARELA